MEHLGDDAYLDVASSIWENMCQGHYSCQLEDLWQVEENCTEEDREDVGDDNTPVTLPCQPALVGVREADSIVAFHGDGDGQEHAGRDRDVAEAITPRGNLDQK